MKYDMMDPTESICVRPRQTGDTLNLPGGRRSLKRLLIDRKIPAARRGLLPVAADAQGILAVYGLGADQARIARPGERAVIIQIWSEERLR